MRQIKIIQLASFRGNIGDNVNVKGTRNLLGKNLDARINYTDLEYLEYEPDPKWGGKKFNHKFVDLVNKHDLLLIGGGGFFELAVDKSCSGTPLDIKPKILERIRCPIVFYSLGFSTTYGLTKERKIKFRKFLDRLLSSKRILISLRNDGSLKRLEEIFGAKYSSLIRKCPDGGFFAPVKDQFHIEVPKDQPVFGLQLAGDNLGRRFVTSHQEEKFFKSLSALMNCCIKKNNIFIVLIPHIPEDLGIIHRFINYLGPPYSRKNISVAPYIHGMEAQDYVFSLYKKADLILGMRLHANIAGIGLGIPTIGLGTFEKIKGLYQELGIPERIVEVNKPHFKTRLKRIIQASLRDRKAINKRYKEIKSTLLLETNKFQREIKKLLIQSK